MTKKERAIKVSYVKQVSTQSHDVYQFLIKNIQSKNYNFTIKTNSTLSIDNILKTKILTVDDSRPSVFTTFAGCKDMDFTYNNGKITCILSVYNGNNFDGHREDCRFTLLVTCKNDILPLLDNTIEYEFDRILDNEYEDYLEEQKRLWKEAREKNIFDEVTKINGR